MAEFGKKRQPVQFTQADLKQAIVRANKNLKARNESLEESLYASNQKLKLVQKEIKVSNKELQNLHSEIKQIQKAYVNSSMKLGTVSNELNSSTSSLNNAIRQEESITLVINKLSSEKEKLENAVNALQVKKDETKAINNELKTVKKDHKLALESLANTNNEINTIKSDLSSIAFEKDGIMTEYNALRERAATDENAIKDLIKTMQDDLKVQQDKYNKDLSRFDSLIAKRAEEMNDLDSLVLYKQKQYALQEAKMQAASKRISEAESKVKTILDLKESNVQRIKDNFKQWKLNQLDEVAKMKLKGKIANIDKAGLREVFDG